MSQVTIIDDSECQEQPPQQEARTRTFRRSRPPQGERAALAEAAKWLAAAEHPVIIADRCVRDQNGVKLLVELAEALQASVVGFGNRINFPSTHTHFHSEALHSLVRLVHVVLLLSDANSIGQVH